MTTWYYSQEGQVRGPCTAEELKELVAIGLLRQQDRVWKEREDPELGTSVETVLNLPDWVEDVARLETRGPVPPTAASHELPDWLEDLRIWYGLEEPVASPAVPPVPTASAASPTLPALPPAGEADTLAEKAVRETGFDPRTGRVLDPERFRQWQRASAAPAGAARRPSNVALMAAFHQARAAVNRWVDDDGHRDLVLRGDLDDMEDSNGIRAILDQYACYGPIMKEKLLKHLAFLVENRRKYYAAVGG
jgi:hypothetical protein